ncbi:MAG: ribosome silencing factor [Bdellovibrionota bacterium]
MNIDKLAQAIEVLTDMKALDGKIIEVGPYCSYADYFVVVSATSTVHAQAMSSALRSLAHGSASPEGYNTGQWILNDLGDIVVHIFLQETRGYYQFDKLWSHAPTVAIDFTPGQHQDIHKQVLSM